ncbi:MAG: 4'-phosphopantetheinyl transferase superfamily protein [Flavobacteriales bacterium]|nr:4'-phosphopantetheinyl transferase superfamily protein [Flavobacteriales bacterium]
MPFIEEKYENNARIGFWHAVESEKSMRAGISLSPSTIEKISKIRSQRRRCEILASRLLMYRMGISDTDLYYDKNGKPFLHSGRYISISHTSHVVCVAVSDYPIGIDIQKISKKLQYVMSRFVRPKEKKEEREMSLIRMSIIWSAKEALFKITGDSKLYLIDFVVRLPKMIHENGFFGGALVKKERVIRRYRVYYGHWGKYVWVYSIIIKEKDSSNSANLN